MAGVQKAKSEETRRRVLEAAVAAVEAGGMEAANIRKIAGEAGYSVGSVYKHFADQDALLIAVNSLTLGSIKEVMAKAVVKTDDPLKQLKALARAYLAFAQVNENLWTTLFAHHLPEDKPVPEWHIQENIALLEFIAGPLKALDPSLEGEALADRTRTCFSAVHGLVTISLDTRFISLTGARPEPATEFLVERRAC